MRTDSGYKELVKKYKFSLSILSYVKPALYKKMVKTAQVLDNNGLHYSQMIRNLRIDYARSNDEKVAEPPRMVTYDKGLYKEINSLSYSPDCYYALGFMHMKESKHMHKRIFVEVVPSDLYKYNGEFIDVVLRISKLNENNEPLKVYEYYVGYTETTMEVFMCDLDKPKEVINLMSVKLEDIDKLYVEDDALSF